MYGTGFWNVWCVWSVENISGMEFRSQASPTQGSDTYSSIGWCSKYILCIKNMLSRQMSTPCLLMWGPCHGVFLPKFALTHWPLADFNEIIYIYVIFKLILVIGGWGIPNEITLRWMSLNLADDKSNWFKHYLSQCWARSLSWYGVTSPKELTFVMLNLL